MKTAFATLCTLEVTHTYYAGLCRDFSFVIPGDTARFLQRGRLMAKVLDSRLHLLFQTADGGGPFVSASGMVLRIGLRLDNSFFGNFTPLAFAPGSAVAVYDNRANSSKLGAPVAAAPGVPLFTHALGKPARPVDVTLNTATGTVISTETVTAPEVTSVSFDLSTRPASLYTVGEEYPGALKSGTAYYVDAELARESLFGIVEIAITDALYTAAPTAFKIDFATREETLKYYVVTRNYPAAEFDSLDVVDKGFDTDDRAKIVFAKVPPASFTADDIQPQFLGTDSDVKIVLFKSTAPVTRRARGHRRLQLVRNGTEIIPNLPQPGEDRANADLVVHLSKPKV